MNREDKIRDDLEDAMGWAMALENARREVAASPWVETRPMVFKNAALPSATIYKLRYGGYRYNLGGDDSATYGDIPHCERALVEAAHTLTPFGAKL